MDNQTEPVVRDSSIACNRHDYDSYVELEFLESSRTAVDEMIHHLTNIVEQPPQGDVIRVFVNSGSPEKPQPIRYLMYRLRESRAKLQPEKQTRIAATFNMMPLAQTINFFLRALRQSTIEFKAFGVGQEQDAIDWLQSNA